MYHLIVNGAHIDEKNKKLSQIKRVFEEAEREYTVHFTERKGHAREIAEKITSDGGTNDIIAMGGDGTLHEILNGFNDFDKNSLGLIPDGTGNDFAKAAAIPENAVRAAEIIVNNTPRPIDFIQLSSGLRSLNAVGTGIDVDVLKRAYAGKRHGKSKYLQALIVSLAKFESIKYKVLYDGNEEEHFGLIAAIGNGIQIGGGIKLFPEADITDGRLDLLIVDYISKAATVGAFIKLMQGKVNRIKQVTAIKCKSASIIPLSDNYTIQAEGELYENVPIEAHVVENRLKFYLP